MIQTEFDKGRKIYGTRRIKQALAQQEVIVSRPRIGRLMAELGLACKVKRTTKRLQIRSMICRLPKII